MGGKNRKFSVARYSLMATYDTMSYPMLLHSALPPKRLPRNIGPRAAPGIMPPISTAASHTEPTSVEHLRFTPTTSSGRVMKLFCVLTFSTPKTLDSDLIFGDGGNCLLATIGPLDGDDVTHLVTVSSVVGLDLDQTHQFCSLTTDPDCQVLTRTTLQCQR